MFFREVFKKANYISPSNPECTGPYILQDLDVPENLAKCEITIIGFGLFELYINGVKVSDEIFVPAQSDYHIRENNQHMLNLEFDNDATKRSYFLKYDLMPYLKTGKNRVAVLLGKGWYCIHGNHMDRFNPYGNEKLCYEITMRKKGGKEYLAALTDKNVKWVQSHIVKSDLFFGEVQDLNIFDTSLLLPESDISALENAIEVTIPDTNYCLQDFTPDRVIRTIKPTLLKDFGDYSVYDAGENITGYVKVKCDKKGQQIKLVHTEEVYPDGNLDGTNFHLHVQTQCDEYTSDGETILVPHFTYHGFRYFSITKGAEPLEVVVVHTDLPVDSYFHSDDETLNWLYEATVRTYLDTVHQCVPFDCPTREKYGYTGDGQLCCEMGMHITGSESFYCKWLADIADSQDTNTGHVPHTAPYNGGGGGHGWGVAIVEVAYMLWKYYGRRDMIEKYFPNMVRWMAYMDARSSHGFITNEEKGWCLGDWGFPFGDENYQLLCPNYVNTYFYVKCWNRMNEIATELGHPKYAKMAREKAEFSKVAMQAAYMSPMNNCFYNDFAGGNSFALDIGIGTETTLNETVRKYDEMGGFDCGIFAVDNLIRVLFENGHADLAFKLLTSHKHKASFGFMKDNGATTIWEYMNGLKSHNHPMFGACVSSFFKYLLGIRQTADSYGYTNVVISPCFVEKLPNLEGYITVPKGRISVKIEGKKVTVDIPKGMKATFDACGVKKKLSSGENVIEL